MEAVINIFTDKGAHLGQVDSLFPDMIIRKFASISTANFTNKMELIRFKACAEYYKEELHINKHGNLYLFTGYDDRDILHKVRTIGVMADINFNFKV